MTLLYKRSLFVVTALAVVALAQVFVDRPLAMALHQFHETVFYDTFRVITWAGWGAPWYVFLACVTGLCFVIFKFVAQEENRDIWFHRFYSFGFALSSLLCSGTIVFCLKSLFGRYRPEKLFEEGLYGFAPFSGNTSFPSGHTQTIVAVMSALWFIYPRYRVLWAGSALLIALSRVIVTKHYLSDVLASTFLAGLVTLVVHEIFVRRKISSFRLH